MLFMQTKRTLSSQTLLRTETHFKRSGLPKLQSVGLR